MPKAYLYPDGTSLASAWVVSGAPTAHEALDEPIASPDDDGSYAASNNTSQVNTLRCSFGAPPPALVVNSVTLRFRSRATGTADPSDTVRGFLYLNSASYYGQTYTNPAATYVERAATWLVNPATGEAFTATDLAGIEAGLEQSISNDAHRATQMFLEVDYVPRPGALEMVRDRLSRELRAIAQPAERVEAAAPLSLGGYEPLTDLALSHFGFPPSGAGVGRTERRLVTVVRQRLDLDTLTLTLTAVDQRHRRVADWDTCFSPQDEVSRLGQGIARLSRGARTFSRGSKAWIESPVDRRLVEIGLNAEKVAADGCLIESERTNSLPRSAFVSAFTGWTKVGEGSNGSAISQDADKPYFDVGIVSAGAVRFQSGSPIHAADLQLSSTATVSLAANTIVCLSLAHLDQGGVLSWWLQRGVDSQYWNDSSATWDAAQTWNALPERSDWTRDRSKSIDVGSSATALTLGAGVPPTGSAGQLNWLGHAQVEEGTYPSSAIVTEASAATRTRDELVVTSSHGGRTWPLRAGCGRAIVRPSWNSADLVSGAEREVLGVELGVGTELERLFFDQGSGWRFRRTLEGSDYDALVATSVIAGQDYKIAWRWTGPEGELGLAPYTLSIWVDDIKGTDAVAAGCHDKPPSSLDMRVGHLGSAGNNVLDGALKWRELLPFVLDDDELLDF